MPSGTDRGLGLALLLVLAGCPEEPPPPPPPSPPLVKPVELPPRGVVPDAGEVADERDGALVLSFAGIVEVRRKGSDAWLALKVGDIVEVGDDVRTGADGALKLSYSVSEVDLKGASQLSVTKLEQKEVGVSLAAGGAAEVSGGNVSLTSGDITATSQGGKLALAFDGATAVATALEGSATVAAGDKSVALKPGEWTSSRGGAPTKPRVVPKVVALAVNWPQQNETNKSELVLSGKASANARVVIGGKPLEVGPDGTFTVTVPLKRGKQSVVLTATDPLGRKVVRARQIVFDPDAPSIRGTVEYR